MRINADGDEINKEEQDMEDLYRAIDRKTVELAALREENERLRDKVKELEDGNRKLLAQVVYIHEAGVRDKEGNDYAKRVLQEHSQKQLIRYHERALADAEERGAREMAEACRRLRKAYPGGWALEDAMQLWREGKK